MTDPTRGTVPSSGHLRDNAAGRRGQTTAGSHVAVAERRGSR